MNDADGRWSQALRFYGALECASDEMLQAARQGDWDSVCRLEAACGVVIARLRDLMASEACRPSEQGERVRILRSIVANDAEIRRIALGAPQRPVCEAVAGNATLH